MSIADVTSRIAQLQSQLAMLDPSTGAAATGFSSALQDATAATGTTTTGSTTGGATGSTSGGAVVSEARKYLGIPYVWGGTNPKTGLDCSGLTQLVFKNLGYDIPRVSYQQATAGTKVDSLAQAKPGDLLAFGSPVHHVAIYIGENKMIEAPRPGKDVRVSEVYETPTHIRRIIDSPAASATSAAGGAVSADVPYARLFNAAAGKYGVSATLLSAVAKQESGYNASAVSGAGARGLMQLMPGTARGLGVRNSFDPAQSVDGAARMLKGLIDTFGRTDLALAAYNAGPGAVKRYHGIPPYPETQHYVRNVLALAKAA
jgi:transglycosylase-like protein with SLT domain/NlpC/P60 family protein